MGVPLPVNSLLTPRGERPCHHGAGESPDSTRPPLIPPQRGEGKAPSTAEWGCKSRVQSALTMVGGGSLRLGRDESPSSLLGLLLNHPIGGFGAHHYSLAGEEG